jgi:hypothetical protein
LCDTRSWFFPRGGVFHIVPEKKQGAAQPRYVAFLSTKLVCASWTPKKKKEKEKEIAIQNRG